MKELISLLFSFIVCFTSFAQSKKEQIEILENRVDSLNNVLSAERSSNDRKVEELNTKITNLESQISSLSSQITNLEGQVSDLKNNLNDNIKQLNESKSEISQKQIKINELNTLAQSKADSLVLLKNELAKFKPASKITTTDNSTGQVTQIGNYKSVKIGTQTWMTENLNVSTFRNGDPIPEAKTNEDWEKAFKNNQPAITNLPGATMITILKMV
jgi:predicted RNase H-like nuclease (RuvC/YqgF family)